MNLGGAHGDIIRSLAALPENKHCMDCDAPNVTRVCTSLHTFVCANCATVLSSLGFVTKPLEGRGARRSRAPTSSDASLKATKSSREVARQ